MILIFKLLFLLSFGGVNMPAADLTLSPSSSTSGHSLIGPSEIEFVENETEDYIFQDYVSVYLSYKNDYPSDKFSQHKCVIPTTQLFNKCEELGGELREIITSYTYSANVQFNCWSKEAPEDAGKVCQTWGENQCIGHCYQYGDTAQTGTCSNTQRLLPYNEFRLCESNNKITGIFDVIPDDEINIQEYQNKMAEALEEFWETGNAKAYPEKLDHMKVPEKFIELHVSLVEFFRELNHVNYENKSMDAKAVEWLQSTLSENPWLAEDLQKGQKRLESI